MTGTGLSEAEFIFEELVNELMYVINLRQGLKSHHRYTAGVKQCDLWQFFTGSDLAIGWLACVAVL